MKSSNKAPKLCLENMKKSPQAPKVAINSRERIKYIHVTKYVTKLGSLQNKRQDQQQALLENIVAEKTKQKQ
ncbi:hypothetical protein HpBGD15_06760 [Helicobacter pylori]